MSFNSFIKESYMNKTFKKLFITSISILFLNLINVQIVKAETTPLPVIIGTIAITMDMDTGEIIYSKNADVHAQPASTTKLMTALLLAENEKKTDYLPFTKNAKMQPSSSIYLDSLPLLKIGDTFTADTVMKALLISSANDMACIISDKLGGNFTSFAKMMNERAKKLGMKNTNFVTPNGLDNNSLLGGLDHYSTAYDLAILGMASYKNSWIKETIALKNNVVISTTTGLNTIIKNTNSNLGSDGCIGGKTGYTDKAGRCFVAIYERQGRRIIGVVLKSIRDTKDTIVFKDMLTIINYSYNMLKNKLYEANSEVSKRTISFKPLKYIGEEKSYEIPVILKEDVTQYSNEINNTETRTEVQFNDIDPWLLDENTILGTFSVNERNMTKAYSLYTTITTRDLVEQNSHLYMICILVIILSFIVLIFTPIIIILFRKKRRAKKLKRFSHYKASVKATYHV